ncbi:MAG: hypothetical protein JNL10_03145 [Verrucomicrobiales bacterium]|nr:hypothetical protein [Verrucomicrobiales bacterium]
MEFATESGSVWLNKLIPPSYFQTLSIDRDLDRLKGKRISIEVLMPDVKEEHGVLLLTGVSPPYNFEASIEPGLVSDIRHARSNINFCWVAMDVVGVISEAGGQAQAETPTPTLLGKVVRFEERLPGKVSRSRKGNY